MKSKSKIISLIEKCVKNVFVVLIVMLAWSCSLFAETQESANAETIVIDSARRAELWKQEDFVKAYLVVAEPGGALYSIFGHAALHMVCDAYGYDCCFTYESESAANRILTFLAGNLKMGMMRLPTESYLAPYKEEGRGAKEYELNLPIEKKRELWRVLDEKTDEGMELPYDYVERGCIYACTKILEEALGDMKIEYGSWSPRYERTRREICNDYGKFNYPWNMMFIMSLVGTDVDRDVKIEDKLIITTEVIEVWQNAKVNGEYLLSRDSRELLPSTQNHKAPFVTPMIVALILLILAIIAIFIETPYIDWLILGIVTLIGAVETYMVIFSTLPCTNWNWLLVPFNILPALCWKWRKYWSLPYAAIIVVWAMGMLVSIHQLVDYSMLVTAIAFMLILLNKRNRKLSLCAKKA